MNLHWLVFRSLRYYWRTGVVVALGIAVATAVIVGSLLIGDSVKGSIKDTALARLGNVDYALVAPGFFRDKLADDLSHNPKLSGRVQRIVPAIIARGAAQNPESEAAIPNVGVMGVDQSFWSLYPGATYPTLAGREAAISRSLARDLGVKEGDSVLLNAERASATPSGTLFAHKSRDETVRTLRLEVKAILPDTGAGGFGLSAGTAAPRNVFVSREWLASELDKAGLANALLVQHRTDVPVQAALTRVCTLADHGLRTAPNAGQAYISLQGAGVLLNNRQVEAAKDAAESCGAEASLTSVYLATTIKKSGSSTGIPYSIVAGVDDAVPFGGLSAGCDGVILNAWAADALQARLGDKIELEYLVPRPDGSYSNKKTVLKLIGIAEMSGAALDRGLVPSFQGITDAGRIDEWNPPFPVDMDRITPRDEAYWDKYRTTPKAFVSLDVLRRMWASNYPGQMGGWVTSVRIHPQSDESLAALDTRFTTELMKHLKPEDSGLVFRPIRRMALASSTGTTDFGQLFLGMSIFLVAAGAGLAGMLMRLSADRRAAEAGIMLASGFSPKTTVRAVVAEGVALTAVGVILGIPMGIAYAAGIIHALTSWWVGAVGASALWLHLTGISIAIGAVFGLATGVLSVAMGARSLRWRQALDLLGGWQSVRSLPSRQSGKRTAVYVIGLPGVALALVGLSIFGHKVPATAAFFGSGAALLAAGIAAASLGLTRAMKVGGAKLSVTQLAIRNAAANRSRSLLVVGLMASAAFIIVTVAANTRDFSRSDFTKRSSGTGGFALRATSSLPIHYDLNSPKGRENLGFQQDDEAAFAGTRIMPLLMSPGEDISCLNLAKPGSPRVLGVNREMIERGGFTVVTGSSKRDNPWSLLDQKPRDGAIPVFGDAASVTWTLHSGLGKTHSVRGEDGRPVKVRFVGLIQGSIFASEILMSEGNFRRVFPSVGDPSYFLIEAAPDRSPKVAEALRRNLGDMGLEVRSTREVLNSFIGVQNTYLSMFLALGGLGVLLGTVGLVAVILRSALERRSEFALMMATGFSRSDLSGLLVLENLGLVVAGLLCGAVSALVSVAPQLASVESKVNWGSIIFMLAGILIIGLCSCAIAARVAVKNDLIDALREE